jgi:uncharacterized membrane protein
MMLLNRMRLATTNLISWFMRPAHWWQFWLPGSGFIGGMLFGLFLIAMSFGLSSIFFGFITLWR